MQSSPHNEITSYHVHSKWSDGTDTVSTLIGQAAGLQLAEVGISDHLILGPDGVGPFSWSLKPDRLDAYIDEIEKESQSTVLPVRRGVEVDYFPGRMSIIEDALAGRNFDYLIGSVHFIDAFPVDESARYWDSLSQSEIDDMCRKYWVLIREMASTGTFHIAGHLDLVKKFAIRSSADLTPQIDAALDTIAQAKMAIELNTSGWDKPCREAYPSAAILSGAVSRNIPILVTADAHRAIDLTNHFERAYAILRDLGAPETVRFAKGKAVRVPLAGGFR